MTDKTREAFEGWCNLVGRSTAPDRVDKGLYWYAETSAAWDAWQAATARAMAEAVRVCESVNNHDNPMTARDCADAIKEALK